MQGKLAHVALASAIASAIPVTAFAVDIDPYFEFAVRREKGPTTYLTDVNKAAAELVAVQCEENGFIYCELTSVGFFNSTYLANYNYETKSGARYHTTAMGYRYYTCDVSPSLYLISGSREGGPYPNRSWTPPPPGGHFVCRVALDPGDGDGSHRPAELGPGDCTTRPNVGNPINAGAGNKYQEVIDIAATASSPLSWARFYNSGAVAEAATPSDVAHPVLSRLGSHWRGTFDRSVVKVDGSNAVRLLRHTGERIDFVEKSGRFVGTADPRGRLEKTVSGWRYYSRTGDIEHFDVEGRLTDINPGTRTHIHLRHGDRLLEASDVQGRSLRFTYDAVGRIESVLNDANDAVSYTYSDAAGLEADLIEAIYADGKSHRYRYNESSYVGTDLPHALTAIFDESQRRFATFSYDKFGRAIGSEHSNGIDRVALSRGADGNVAVTDALNAVRTYRYAEIKGVRRLVGVDQPGGAGCGAAFSKLEYDDNGSPKRVTDFDGRITEYTHDADGRETSRTEAAGTPLARAMRTEWHGNLMLPTRITLPGREERLTYDDAGNLIRRELWAAIDPTQKDSPLSLSRAWKYTYDADGRLLEEHGPRSDASGTALLHRYTYRASKAANCGSGGACDYLEGDLATIENALGHKDEILRVDLAGRILSRRTANGTLVESEYGKRGWLTSVKESRIDGTVATTSLGYDERGNITSITDADGVTLRFEYDAANRLVKLFNPSNHKLFIDLDKAGHPVAETVYDSFTEKARLKRTFDALGRLATEQGKDAGLVSFTYDEVGRPTGVTDGDGHRSSSSYDALGRLMKSVDDLDDRKAAVSATYDPLDQVSSLEDPDGVKTRYLTTGLGDLAHVDSPDGGETYDEYDASGLVARHEGASGVGSFGVSRDALGRPLTLAYSDAALDTTFRYDAPDAACPGDRRNGIGMLSSMATTRGSTLFCYDAAGNVARKVQQRGSIRKALVYSYTKAGRLASMGVEGGATAFYSYDIDGKINGVSVEQSGKREGLISKVAYRPFDAIESWTYANGWVLSNSRDNAGRLTVWGTVDPKGATHWLDPSPGGQIRADVTRPTSYSFGYDGLNYLNEVRDYSTNKSLLAIDYNASGDRLATRADGVTDTYGYLAGTHRLIRADGKARQYDAAGNLTAIGSATLAYDATGRLASASESGRLLVSYGYDGEGNRIARKVASTNKNILSLFDEAGQWVADYDETGRVIQQAIWMGDIPVGIVDGGKLYYVGPDHLGSPIDVLDPVRNVTVWQWRHSAEPFGAETPNEDPDRDGTRFQLNMRFPGQIYDDTTGFHANGARDYDPLTGRYIQVDPIGLLGGMNPYLYVEGSPLIYADPSGLVKWNGYVRARSVSLGLGVGEYEFGLISECVAQKRASVIVKALAVGIGLNIKNAPPIAATGSTITLEDRMKEVDPEVLNGWFSTWGAGASLGLGRSASTYQVGGNGMNLARPRNAGAWAKPSYGPEIGVELGAGGMAGRSRVVATEWSACGCQDK